MFFWDTMNQDIIGYCYALVALIFLWERGRGKEEEEDFKNEDRREFLFYCEALTGESWRMITPRIINTTADQLLQSSTVLYCTVLYSRSSIGVESTAVLYSTVILFHLSLCVRKMMSAFLDCVATVQLLYSTVHTVQYSTVLDWVTNPQSGIMTCQDDFYYLQQRSSESSVMQFWGLWCEINEFSHAILFTVKLNCTCAGHI
jgi:hypothetical protein